MKRTILIFLVFLAKFSIAQTVPDFDLIKLDKVSDYKAAEPFVLQTSTYLLSTPFDSKNENRSKSLQFIARWMSGTAEQSFVLDDAASKIIKGNDDLIGIYLAAMAKFSLENKQLAKDPKVVKLNAINSLLDYSSNKINNLKPGKQLKKLLDAREKGQLEQLLNN